jgi:hypothetical protein
MKRDQKLLAEAYEQVNKRSAHPFGEEPLHNNGMNDLSDYIVKEEDKFYVDTYDVDTEEPTFEDKEIFTFEYEGTRYEGYAIDEGDEMSLVRITSAEGTALQ